jgi:hypothetical protein
MRLTSQIWVSAFLRAQEAEGAFATVLRKGASEAGAVFIAHNRLDATYSIYAPAPQSMFAAGEVNERRFECIAEGIGEKEMADYFQRQVKFDPDCWIVETERRDPPAFLDTV